MKSGNDKGKLGRLRPKNVLLIGLFILSFLAVLNPSSIKTQNTVGDSTATVSSTVRKGQNAQPLTTMSLPRYTTPECASPFPQAQDCTGLCKIVGDFVAERRTGVLNNPKS